MRDQPNRALGAAKSSGALGSESGVMDTKMQPVKEGPIGHVGEPRQEPRGGPAEENARDAIDGANLARVVNFAEVMQQPGGEQVAAGILTPQATADFEQMHLIVGRQLPERVSLARGEELGDDAIAILGDSNRPEGAQTLIEAMQNLSKMVAHVDVKIESDECL